MAVPKVSARRGGEGYAPYRRVLTFAAIAAVGLVLTLAFAPNRLASAVGVLPLLACAAFTVVKGLRSLSRAFLEVEGGPLGTSH